jgi:hypothetical protein
MAMAVSPLREPAYVNRSCHSALRFSQKGRFTTIENYFIAAGCSSSLMYLHNSPGLLRVKHKAGI